MWSQVRRGSSVGAVACFRMEWIVGSVEAGWGGCGGHWKISPHSFSRRCLVVCSGQLGLGLGLGGSECVPELKLREFEHRLAEFWRTDLRWQVGLGLEEVGLGLGLRS